VPGSDGLYPSRNARDMYGSNRTAGTVSMISFATEDRRPQVAKVRSCRQCLATTLIGLPDRRPHATPRRVPGSESSPPSDRLASFSKEPQSPRPDQARRPCARASRRRLRPEC
jgi:hypothetical protein